MTSNILAATALALALTAAPAAAQVAKPVPCTGNQAQDATGDAFVGFVGNDTPIPADPSGDLKTLFFRRDKGKVTVNFSLTEVKKAVPPGATSLSYRMYFNIGDVQNFIQTSLATGASEPTYVFGHTELPASNVVDGDTKGQWVEGADGVISVEIPASHLPKVDSKLTEGYLFSALVRGAVNTQTDQIPDGDARFAWTNSECPGAEAPAGPLPGAPAVPGSNPSTPPPATPTNKPGSGSGAATGPLQIGVSPLSLKSKKVKKSLAFKLDCKEALKAVTVQFKKGSKVVSKGSLASCSGKTTLKLKLAKKLKKGSYTLVFAGKRADGSANALTVKVKVA
jgi:methionine-rich copper-binding protein CopC